MRRTLETSWLVRLAVITLACGATGAVLGYVAADAIWRRFGGSFGR